MVSTDLSLTLFLDLPSPFQNPLLPKVGAGSLLFRVFPKLSTAAAKTFILPPFKKGYKLAKLLQKLMRARGAVK